MATFNKFNQHVADVWNGVHDSANDQITVALTNTAPTAANSVLADITQISYTGLSSRNATTTSSTQTAGLYKLIVEDLNLTQTGSTLADWQYAVAYNSTAAGGPLIGWWDYGTAISLTDGSSVVIDFDQVNGLLNAT